MNTFWSAVNSQVRDFWLYVESLGVQGRRLLSGYLEGRRGYLAAWPPVTETDRLARYARYRALYEGRHEEVYVGHGKYCYDDQREYLTVNLAGEIVELIVARLFGEFPSVRTPLAGGQEWLDALLERSGWRGNLPRAARGGSYRGDAALKIRLAAGAVLIQPVNPAMLVFETDPEDVERIIRATQGWVLWQDDEAYLRHEIHSAGAIDHRLYRLHSARGGIWGYDPEGDRVALNTLPALAGLTDEQPTGVDELLIIHVGTAAGDEGELWGRSDLADVDPLQGELNNRYTQRAEILDRHADPYMQGPPDLIDENGKLKIDPQNRYVALVRPENRIEYLVWEAQLAAVDSEIVELKRDMLLIAGISPESMQLGEQAAAESGRALKLRQHRTAATVRERQQVWDQALTRALAVASQLSNSTELKVTERGPLLAPGDITIGWQDGLPADTMQEIEEEVLAVQGRVSSRQAAIMRLYRVDEKGAQAELKIIAAEEQEARPRVSFGPEPAGVDRTLGTTIVPVTPATETGVTAENTD